MLLGEYHHNIDDKGRLVIPTKLREDLGEEFILTRGIEKCLYVYSKEECIIIGVNDHLEIWDSKAFEDFMSDNSDIIEDIAENLFDGDKNAL